MALGMRSSLIWVVWDNEAGPAEGWGGGTMTDGEEDNEGWRGGQSRMGRRGNEGWEEGQ